MRRAIVVVMAILGAWLIGVAPSVGDAAAVFGLGIAIGLGLE